MLLPPDLRCVQDPALCLFLNKIRELCHRVRNNIGTIATFVPGLLRHKLLKTTENNGMCDYGLKILVAELFRFTIPFSRDELGKCEKVLLSTAANFMWKLSPRILDFCQVSLG